MADRQQFEKAAYRLADIESRLIDALDAAGEVKDNAAFISSQKKDLMIALGEAALGIVLMIFLPASGLLAMCPVFLLVFGLMNIYVVYGGIRFGKKNILAQQSAVNSETQLIRERSGVTAQLMEMQKNDPSLPQECWWNAGADIKCIRSLHPIVPDGHDLILANELIISEQDGKLYLEDFTKKPVLWEAEEVNKRIHEKRKIILYENPDYSVEKVKQFLSCRVYHVKAEIIEEIASKTTTVTNVRAEKMKEYQDKLDREEIFFNMADGEGAYTNLEAAAFGYRTKEEFEYETRIRSMLESNMQDKLNSQPDSYDSTEYRKVFRGLWRCSFISEADVFISADPESSGEVAYIVTSLTLPKGMHMNLKADDKNTPTGGFLVTYAGEEGLSFDKIDGILHFKEVVQFLFNPEARDRLGLKDRNILAPKPENLINEFWTYLIAKDHRRKDLSERGNGPAVPTKTSASVRTQAEAEAQEPVHMSSPATARSASSVPKEEKQCPFCEQEVSDDMKACIFCGNKIPRCPTCGTIIYRKIKFCGKDGTRIPEELVAKLPEM